MRWFVFRSSARFVNPLYIRIPNGACLICASYIAPHQPNIQTCGGYGTNVRGSTAAITLRLRSGQSHYSVGTTDVLLTSFATLAASLFCFGKRNS